MRCLICTLAVIGGLGLGPGARLAAAQQRPLVTEDPEPIGSGRMMVEGGFDYLKDVTYPVSGLTGDLLKVPTVGVSVGLSSIVELQIDGGFYNRLTVTERRDAPLSNQLDFTGDRTTDVEDLVVATKIRFVSESPGRPALGVRLATRLPNAGNESGLGLDTTDFFATLLGGKTVRSVRIVGNFGFAILGDPTRGDRQNDVITYGLSAARALTNHIEVVGEINGRADTRNGEPPPGTENRAAARAGARFTKGPVRLDTAAIVGVTAVDPRVGFTLGFTYVFDAFRVP